MGRYGVWTWVWMCACVASSACDALPAGPEIQSATCVAALRFDGHTYGLAEVTVQGAFVPAGAIGSVTRDLGCNDTPQPGESPAIIERDGDSNFLPVGTAVHAVEGFTPAERLAVRPDTVWILLEPAPSGR